MFPKVILLLALLAFITLPLAHSLRCYICGDFTCKNPATVICDQNYAIATQEAMKLFYNGVKDLNSTNYSCMMSRYRSNGTTVMNIRGCITNGAFNCDLQLKNQTWSKDVCKVCRSDNCNYSNAVGSYSSSFSILITLLVLIKVFIV